MKKNLILLRTGKEDYETKRLLEEGNKLANIEYIDYVNDYHIIDKKLSWFSSNKEVKKVDAVIPRIYPVDMETGAVDFSFLVLRFIEQMGIPTLNSSESIMNCQDKFITSLILQKKKVPQPKSLLAVEPEAILDKVSHMKKPLVIKVLDGTQGKGIAKIDTDAQAKDWFEAFEHFHKPLYLQEYIENPGEDYRLFILGDKVIGAMRRIAKKGNWKSNFHLGAKTELFNPPAEMKKIALKAHKAIKTNQSGVDIIRHDNQYKVIEVNQNPGFRGLEKATGKNIAREIIKFTLKLTK